MRKTYLGDGVYVDHDGFHVILTTENGINRTNIIYIEPSVWVALVGYVKDLKKGERNADDIHG